MRNQVGRIFNVPVSEISEVLVQQATGLLRSHLVFVLYRLAIISKSLDGNPPFSIFSAAERATVPLLVV